MALYDDLQGMLTKRGYGHSFTAGRMETAINRAAAAARSEGRPITGYQPLSYKWGHSGKGGIRTQTVNVPIFGQSEAELLAPIQAEQQRLAGIMQAAYEKQQADIAKQLKIAQEEKSAVSKMQEEYSNMLLAEAERKKQAQEQAKRDLITQRANQARTNKAGSLQIQGAGTVPRVGGTQQFRRRALQQGTASPYKGLSTIQSGMVNV